VSMQCFSAHSNIGLDELKAKLKLWLNPETAELVQAP